MWAKLSPNVTDLADLAGVALESGAEAVTLINTVMGMAIDPVTGAFRLGAGGGGMSGPAVHPWRSERSTNAGCASRGRHRRGGGVTTGYEAAELLAAGADAVQVGTATFADPGPRSGCSPNSSSGAGARELPKLTT